MSKKKTLQVRDFRTYIAQIPVSTIAGVGKEIFRALICDADTIYTKITGTAALRSNDSLTFEQCKLHYEISNDIITDRVLAVIGEITGDTSFPAASGGDDGANHVFDLEAQLIDWYPHDMEFRFLRSMDLKSDPTNSYRISRGTVDITRILNQVQKDRSARLAVNPYHGVLLITENTTADKTINYSWWLEIRYRVGPSKPRISN